MGRAKGVKPLDRTAFLEMLQAATGDYKIKATVVDILDWATEQGLSEGAGLDGNRANAGYTVTLSHGGESYRLFKLMASGDIQFQTDEERDTEWFQQKPPFDQPEMRNHLHEKLKPLPAKAFPNGGEQKDPMRLALRAVANLPTFLPGDKKDKPRLALRWLEGEATRAAFLDAFTWVVNTIRAHQPEPVS